MNSVYKKDDEKTDGKHMMSPAKRGAHRVVWAAVAVACLHTLNMEAQIGASRNATLRGVVVSAASRQPVNRALVEVSQRAMLTGPDGRFEFSGLTEPSVQIRVTKPGFYSGFEAGQEPVTVSLDPAAAANNSPSSDTASAAASDPVVGPIEVAIYPEALVTGTVSAPNGDPLPQIQVQALRRQDEEMGAKWAVSGQSSTNSDGEFRLALPPGDYIVETQYSARVMGMQKAALPVLFPEPGAGSAGETGGPAMMHLSSGAEEHLDLRPPVRPSYAVHLKVDSETGEGLPQLEARTANGLSFRPGGRAGESPGELIASLPPGTYLLTGTSRGRDGTAYGETRVTVGGGDVQGVPMHMARTPTVNVNVSYDESDASSPGSTSVVASFRPTGAGLFLSALDAPIGLGNQTRYLIARQGQTASTDLSPGRYRMRSQQMGQWYVESATLGDTNLLTEDLVIDSSSSGGVINVVMSDKTGKLQGAVKLNGKPAACWVYLVETTPSANPLTKSMSGVDGTLNNGYLPPGSYEAVAFEKKPPANLLDADVLAEFSANVKTFTVAAGETATVMLDAVPAAELKP